MIKRVLTILLALFVTAIAVTIFIQIMAEISASIYKLNFIELVLFFLACICFFPTLIIFSYFLLYKVGSSLIVYLNKKDVFFSIMVALLCNAFIVYYINTITSGDGATEGKKFVAEIIILLCFVAVVLYNGIFAAKYNKPLWDVMRVTISRVQISMMITYLIPLYFLINHNSDNFSRIEIDDLITPLCYFVIITISPIMMIRKVMKFEGVKVRQKAKIERLK